jgi:hypothetical protein
MELLKIGGELMTTSWKISECRATKLGEFNPNHFHSFSFLRVGFSSVEGKQADCYLITEEFILKT